MHSSSFQDTELKLCRLVEDDSGQVVEGLKLWGGSWGTVGEGGGVGAGDGSWGGGGELGCCKGPGNAGQPS